MFSSFGNFGFQPRTFLAFSAAATSFGGSPGLRGFSTGYVGLLHAFLPFVEQPADVAEGEIEIGQLVSQIDTQFGSQCVVVSIDARRNADLPSGYEAVGNRGRTPASGH